MSTGVAGVEGVGQAPKTVYETIKEVLYKDIEVYNSHSKRVYGDYVSDYTKRREDEEEVKIPPAFNNIIVTRIAEKEEWSHWRTKVNVLLALTDNHYLATVKENWISIMRYEGRRSRFEDAIWITVNIRPVEILKTYIGIEWEEKVKFRKLVQPTPLSTIVSCFIEAIRKKHGFGEQT